MRLEEMLPSKRVNGNATLEMIEREVERAFHLKHGELHADTKVGRIAWPRQVAMYFMRAQTGNTYHFIGRHFDKDHGTVIHAEVHVREMMETYPLLKSELKALGERIEKNENGIA